MKDINIVAINSKYVHTLLAPYYLKANCKYPFVNIIQTSTKADIEEIVKISTQNNPLAIAFSTYIFNASVVEQVCKKIKDRFKNIKIILGGPEVSYGYENEYLYADYIIVGEGESAFSNLVDVIVGGGNCDRIIEGNSLPLEQIISPYTKDYFSDVEGKIAYFESSRGCPFRCAYCLSGGSKLRYFNINYVKSALENFKQKNIRVLKFVDRTFNANNNHAVAILNYLIENHRSYNFSFHFEIAADLLTQEQFDVIKTAPKGLFQFEIGVQSFNEQTLNAVSRKTDLAKVVENIKRLVDIGNAHIHTDLIAGMPFENLESFKRSFNLLYLLKSDMLQLGFLKVLKGSSLRETLSDDYVYSQSPPYEIISTPYLTREDIEILKKVEESVEWFYNSGRFSNTLNRFANKNFFDFYLSLYDYAKQAKTLFEKFEAILEYLSDIGEDKQEIIGFLTIDYVLKNSSRTLPPCLKKYSKNFKENLIKLNLLSSALFCVECDVNPYTFELDYGILAINYNTFEYSYYSLNKEN